MFPKQLTCVALAAMFAAAPLIASAAVAPRNAPSPVLIGYAHNWDEGDPYQGRGFDSTAPYIRLVDFPTTYNVLVVSFATGDAQSGTVYFKPKIQTPEEFKADVQVCVAMPLRVGPGSVCQWRPQARQSLLHRRRRSKAGESSCPSAAQTAASPSRARMSIRSPSHSLQSLTSTISYVATALACMSQ
jgi:hypothetical protein